MQAITAESTIQLTIEVPGRLYERIAQLVRCGAAESASEFVVESVENRVNKLRRDGFGGGAWGADNSGYGEEGPGHEFGPCEFDVVEEEGE